jgi:HD-like signal output (HDOD) protein
MEDFANVICIDPSMTSRLLQIANSAIYSFSGQISTISRAVTVVGTRDIYNMILVDVSSSAFKHFGNNSIDLQRFWRASIYCGLAAKNIAIRLGIKDIEYLFVAGLLLNIGELIVANVTPELAEQCEGHETTMPWDFQKKHLGFSYNQLSAELLKSWDLPKKIILPIFHQHKAGDISINQDVKILDLAAKLALIDSHRHLYSVESTVSDSLLSDLSLNETSLASVIEFADLETESIIKVMSAVNP